MRISLFFLFAMLAVFRCNGCINGDSEVLADGTFLYGDFEGHLIPYGHEFNASDYSIALRQLDSLWRLTHEAKYRSDYGLVLLLQKKYDLAEEIFLEIEREFPGRYATASNLGTLYELMGRNKDALAWISKAVTIDPNSHMASEWLHVNILKAKLLGEEKYTTDFLLGTSFGDGIIPQSEWSEDRLEKLRNALYFQLNERVSFVKPPDKIVGVLLQALGDVCWLTGYQVPAVKNYERALQYGHNTKLLNARFRRAQEKQVMLSVGPLNDTRDYITLYVVLAGCSVVMAFITVSAFRK